ncbi:hypothetical protein LTR36_000561 [Oleoguttula mirabilis]|uniref:Uncharacterized protein n=1 Tax=Oleoguttula mirabilis TaxID=1507867 RepID=A0AAV9JPS7_9PEZI|nr:hypothetical protein LTR36_000561 [Oleoguttula mirabilis]
MKGSAVVQGLKAWASKLHPQLPLSSKESQRLLTALTSSFRQHLDEVHPRPATEDGRQKPGSGGASKTSTHAMHSSAALADKHLASVLMNPLLTKASGGVKKADQDFANAQVELQKNPAKDPISLLEEYHEKGAATVPIARLCLEIFTKSLDGLPEGMQQKETTECGAGRRTLLWLWKSEQYKQAAFVDDKTFISLLVPLLMKEGHEEYLWEWIQLDQALAEGESTAKHGRPMYHRYLWKGRLLSEMVNTKLGPPHRERKSADAALAIYSRGCKLKLSAPDGNHMEHLPLAQAATSLGRAFRASQQDYRCTDPKLYEEFIDTVVYSQDKVPEYNELQRADLWLQHPTKPRALPAFKFWQQLFNDPHPCWQRFGSFVRQGAMKVEGQKALNWYMMMVRATALLLEQGCSEEAAWMEGRILEVFPTSASKYLQRDLKRHREEQRERRQTVEPAVAERIPFPTFA